MVSLNGEDKVAIIDVASRKVLRRAPVGNGPVQVSVTPDGKTALVANQGSAAKPDNRVSVISLDDGRLIKSVTVGKGAHGVVIGPDGGISLEEEARSDLLASTFRCRHRVVAGSDVIGARLRGEHLWLEHRMSPEKCGWSGLARP